MTTEKRKAYQREYYQKHKDRYRELYRQNREKHDETTKKWQKKHPEKMVENWLRCYARKLAKMTGATVEVKIIKGGTENEGMASFETITV